MSPYLSSLLLYLLVAFLADGRGVVEGPWAFFFSQSSFKAGDRVVDPDPRGSALICVSGSGCESMRAKMTHKYWKKLRIFMFRSAGSDVLFWELKASPVACATMCVLYGGLRIQKINKNFTAENFFQFSIIFGHQNPGFGTGSGSVVRKMLDPDPH